MKCDNCGKENANVKYLRNINGVKKEMNLCEECSRRLGITDISFNMPIDFTSFLGGFLDEFENQNLLSLIEPRQKTKCKGCNFTFEDILNTGKFGCPECYNTFEVEIDNLMNKIHGSNRHKGRIGKLEEPKVENKNHVNGEKINKTNTEKIDSKETIKQTNQLEQLKEELKQLIKDEKYEQAAIIRDKIKELEEK